jgi:hypothetical protein
LTPPLKTSAGVGIDAHQSDEQDADGDIDKIEHDATSISEAEMRRKPVSDPFGIAAPGVRKR